MKRVLLLSLAMTVAVGAFCQSAEGSLKDARAAQKEKKAPAEIIKLVTPALESPETNQQAEPWVIAGKASIQKYDDMFLKGQLQGEGALTVDDRSVGSHGLIDGYNYLLTALPLDPVTDAKGKVKTKFTKEIQKELVNNYQSLLNAAAYLWDIQDYNGAYDAWDLWATLPTNPLLGDKAPAAQPDTVIGQVQYFQGLAAYGAQDIARALESFRKATANNFRSIDLYKFACQAADALNDSVALLEFATLGFDNYGAEDIAFIGHLINNKLNSKDYEGGYELVDHAIANTEDPKLLAQLNDVMGFIYEQDGKVAESVAAFQKAIDLDPEASKPYYDMARVIYNQAITEDEATTDEAVRTSKINPQLQQAGELFKKAYEMDEDNYSNIPGILYRLYYRLGDEAQANKYKNL